MKVLRRAAKSLASIIELLISKFSFSLARLLYAPGKNQRRGDQGIALFVVYGSPVSRVIAGLVGKHLSMHGYRQLISTPKKLLTSYSKEWLADLDNASHRFSSIDQLTRFIEQELTGHYFFKRGVIDEFIRRVPRQFLTRRYQVPNSFLETAARCLEEARSVVSRVNVVVLTSSGYLQKNALIAAAFEAKKPVFILSPFGGWSMLGEDSTFDYLSETPVNQALEMMQANPSVVGEANSYFDSRLSGRGKLDIDAELVYSGKNEQAAHEYRKVLFLHAIRDANHLPLAGTKRFEFFTTFLDWTEFALKEVAKSPDEWWIKPHPQSHLFPDEEQIVRDLAEKCGVPQRVIAPDLDTRWVLQSKMPVFTCRGTIALEAAARGYMATVATEVYSNRICWVPESITQAAEQYQKKLAQFSSVSLESPDVDLAKVMLFARFLLPLKRIVPRNLGWQQGSRLQYELFELRILLELLARYCTLSTHREAKRVAEDVLSRIKVD